MNTHFRIEVSVLKGSDARLAPTVHLHVEDKPSGTVLVDVDMDAGQWLALTSASSLSVPGFVGNHLERVGRSMAVRSMPVPRDVAFSRDGKSRALDYALTHARDGEETEVRNTNQGWEAIFRSWP